MSTETATLTPKKYRKRNSVVATRTEVSTAYPAQQAVRRDELTRWRPGQSGNPRGRPNIGASVMDWTNQMDRWDDDRLRAVMADKAAPRSKKAAARWLLDVATQDRTKGGTPVAGPELDRLLDRTLGKPQQQVSVTSTRMSFSLSLGSRQVDEQDVIEQQAEAPQIEGPTDDAR
jgi:hypothetical protein